MPCNPKWKHFPYRNMSNPPLKLAWQIHRSPASLYHHMLTQSSPSSPLKHTHPQPALHRRLKMAKIKEASWSLASSSSSLPLRLHTPSLSICLIGADTEEWVQPGQWSPITLTSPWAKNSHGLGHFTQDPGFSQQWRLLHVLPLIQSWCDTAITLLGSAGLLFKQPFLCVWVSFGHFFSLLNLTS